MSFGDKLSEIRKSKKLSQQDLAKRLNKTYTVIGKYERGDVIPSLEVVREIANILEISPAYLIDDKGELDILKNPDIARRMQDIVQLEENDQHIIFSMMDAFLRDAKARQTYR